MQIRKIAIILTGIYILSGCVGNTQNSANNNGTQNQAAAQKVNTPNAKSSSLANLPVPGILTNFVSEALNKWAKSKFLEQIGLGPDTDAKLGQILGELNTITQNIQHMQQQLSNILFTDNAIKQELDNLNYGDASDAIDAVTQFNSVTWNQYENHLGTMNLDTIAKNQNGVLDALEPLMTDELLANFEIYASDSSSLPVPSINSTQTNISSNGILVNSDPNMIPEVIKAMQQLLQDNLKNQGVAQMPAVLDGYNESLMSIYARLVKTLQTTYTLQSTALYLAYNASTAINPVNNESYRNYFFNLSIGAGLQRSNTFANNQATLDTLYKKRFANLQKLFTQAIITDWANYTPLTDPTNPSQTIQYTKAVNLLNSTVSTPGITWVNVGGSWQNSCEYYVWQGIINPHSLDTSAFNSGEAIPSNYDSHYPLMARCSVDHFKTSATTLLDYSTLCNHNSAVTFDNGNLVCDSVNKNPSIAGWDEGARWEMNLYTLSGGEEGLFVRADNNVVGPNALVTSQGNAMSYNSGGNYADTFWDAHALTTSDGNPFSSVFMFSSNSFTAPYEITQELHNYGEGFDTYFDTQIHCLNGQNDCVQLNGFESGNNGGGGSAICIGDPQNSNSNHLLIKLVGEPAFTNEDSNVKVEPQVVGGPCTLTPFN